ncbi:MAG: extracellular solute-binding protein, partial [Chloroflexi bacterium]|nr:extracellular solute-binding protein [Chloroflexota bacterium]
YGVNLGSLQNLWGLSYLWKDNPFLQQEYTTGIAPATQLDHPGVIASAQAAADLANKHKVAPTPADVQTMAVVGDIFSTGKIGIEFTLPTFAYRNFQDAPFKWGLAPIPRQKANKTEIYNGAWFIERQTKAPEASWEFVTYLVSDPVAEQFREIAGFPVPLKSQLDPWLKQFVSKTGMTLAELRDVITSADTVGVEYAGHLFVNYFEIDNTLTQGLDALWTGKASAQQAITAVKPSVDAVVAKTYKEYAGKQGG